MIDIDLISKISKIYADGSSSFVGARLSRLLFESQHFEIKFMEIRCLQMFPYVLMFFRIIWHIQIIEQEFPGAENLEIMRMLGFGLSNNRTDNLLDQN